MKKIISNFLLLLVSINLSAQNQTGALLQKNKELTLFAGPSFTKLVNTNIDRDDFKFVDKRSGANFTFGYHKYYKNRIGFGLGIGYSNYKQTIYQKGLFVKSNQTDKDGYTYDMWIDSDMKYTTSLNYLDIPIMLHLLLGHSNNFYGFIDIGIVNSLLAGSKYTKKGSIENMGAYSSAGNNPYFYLVSHNNSYYDHRFEAYDKEYTEDIYKSYNLSFRASFGIAAAMTERLTLRVVSEFTKGLSDITGKDYKGKDYENVFGEKSTYKPTKTFSLGLNIGFGFNL